MGFRQPSQVSAIFAQTKSGAEQQKRARDKLKTPTALGGAATAGTGMIASKTKAQTEATEQVKGTTAQAQKDLKVDPTKFTETVTAIGGTVKPPPATTTSTTSTTDTKPPPVEYTGGISELIPSDTKIPDLMALVANDKDLIASSVIDSEVREIDSNINKINTNIERINTLLTDASAKDAQNLQAEKERLIKLREEYVKKRDEENLGQIAGPSALETTLSEREQLLAAQDPYLEDGTDTSIAKLSSILGPRWKSKSAASKALASQVYGKDLETLGEQAAAGLRESERAKIAADEADEQYVAQLDASKKAYEEQFEDEDRKLELLGMTPKELKGVTQKEVEELYGKELANELFDFKDGYVSDTTVSQTRVALDKKLTDLKNSKSKADQAKAKIVERLQNEIFPKDEFGNPQPNTVERLQNELTGVADAFQNNIGTMTKYQKELENAVSKGDVLSARYLKDKMDTYLNETIQSANAERNRRAEEVRNRQKEKERSQSNRGVNALVTGGLSEIPWANKVGDKIGDVIREDIPGGRAVQKGAKKLANWGGEQVSKLRGLFS